MTPDLMRSLWNLIELFPPNVLLNGGSESFVDLLITQLQETHELEAAQIKVVRTYIEQRIPLVYELNERGQFSKYPYLRA